MSRYDKGIDEIRHLILVEVDAVFRRVFETLSENSRETKYLPLPDTDRIEDVLVALVHLCSRYFVWPLLKLAFEM